MEKSCTMCKETLSLESFHKNSSSKDGLRSQCKSCKNTSDKVYRVENKVEVSERQKLYYHNNKEVFFHNNATRRGKHRLATPAWLSDSQKAHIKRTYRLAALMKDITESDYHVDHIVPLQGKSVCGLHVPWNLQVLRADLNLRKSNLLEGDAF